MRTSSEQSTNSNTFSWTLSLSFDVVFPHFKAKVLDIVGGKYHKMFVGVRGGRAVAKEVLDALIKRSKNEASGSDDQAQATDEEELCAFCTESRAFRIEVQKLQLEVDDMILDDSFTASYGTYSQGEVSCHLNVVQTS